MKKHIIPTLLILVGLTALSFTLAKGVTLRLKPPKNKTYTVTSKANMMTAMDMGGQTMNMSQVIEDKLTFSAKDVSNTQCVFEVQLESLKMSISQMGMKIEYDSEHPEKNSPLFEGLDEKIKEPKTTTYDATGHYLGDESVDDLNGVIIPFPEQEVNVGSKWTSRKTQSISGFDYILELEYEVVSISKKSVDLTFNGIYLLDMGDDLGNASGTYSGTCSVDPETGILITSTGNMNMTMTISEEGFDIPATITGITVINVK